ncbi:MAG: D-tyrosyl-tRNA(Tyr) deacylase [Clostridia bacterium]|nr:D-tyrosyl-tRNA(Tyr) deacylase [Clostridia bacterium]
MRAVVQRVKSARLICDEKVVSETGFGLVVFLGVKAGDDRSKAETLAKKICALRIFADENGKSNLSVKDVGGEILAVSQFTLLGDVSRGNRPSFTDAEKPDAANETYEFFLEKLKENGVEPKKGVFGGDMTVYQVNDGPYTIIYDI